MRGSSNLLDVTMNAIVSSKILELSYWLNELSPKRRVSISAKSLRVINLLFRNFAQSLRLICLIDDLVSLTNLRLIFYLLSIQ